MLLLGIDVGTSFIKASVVDGANGNILASGQSPDTECSILSIHTGWAEQSADTWWLHVKHAIKRVVNKLGKRSEEIGAIGISYQMHGLVLVDKEGKLLRNSIIWCDSRAVSYGETAFQKIGQQKCLSHLLNSPGNFTAAKLAWVKEHEPHLFERIDKVLLPGDFIAMKFTGGATTTPSALSEAILWDFKSSSVSEDVLSAFGFESSIIPPVQEVFSEHGCLMADIAIELGLKPGIPVTYKSGDQPNNALSLNVLEPGEVAATAGTSGVIYAISNQLSFDSQSRINSFAHVNHSGSKIRIGVLLCINGTGIFNKWIKEITGNKFSYPQMNEIASVIPPGSEGLKIFPFGNGAERIFNNRIVGAHVCGIDLNKHSQAHLFRAGQEGIAFAFRYGLDIMRENGISPRIIRANDANMFKSEVFTEAFVNVTGIPLQLYEYDSSAGAALGAGIGAGYYKTPSQAFLNRKVIKTIEPLEKEVYGDVYEGWRGLLERSCLGV